MKRWENWIPFFSFFFACSRSFFRFARSVAVCSTFNCFLPHFCIRRWRQIEYACSCFDEKAMKMEENSDVSLVALLLRFRSLFCNCKFSFVTIFSLRLITAFHFTGIPRVAFSSLGVFVCIRASRRHNWKALSFRSFSRSSLNNFFLNQASHHRLLAADFLSLSFFCRLHQCHHRRRFFLEKSRINDALETKQQFSYFRHQPKCKIHFQEWKSKKRRRRRLRRNCKKRNERKSYEFKRYKVLHCYFHLLRFTSHFENCELNKKYFFFCRVCKRRNSFQCSRDAREWRWKSIFEKENEINCRCK